MEYRRTPLDKKAVALPGSPAGCISADAPFSTRLLPACTLPMRVTGGFGQGRCNFTLMCASASAGVASMLSKMLSKKSVSFAGPEEDTLMQI
jgi:hypothetical protein